MENQKNKSKTQIDDKLLFTGLVFTCALIAGYFFYTDKITSLESELQATSQEHNIKLKSELQAVSKKHETKFKTELRAASQKHNTQLKSELQAASQKHNTQLKTLQVLPKIIQENPFALESLSNQLIKSQSALKASKAKLSLLVSKTIVLKNTVAQMNDAKNQIKKFKSQVRDTKKKMRILQVDLESVEQKLTLSTKKVSHLENVFITQNTQRITQDIAKIKALKETIGGAAITGFIAPVIGIATLISYTSDGIDNYCSDIENTLNLEKKVFGKVVSLNAEIQQNYDNQCK